MKRKKMTPRPSIAKEKNYISTISLCIMYPYNMYSKQIQMI